MRKFFVLFVIVVMAAGFIFFSPFHSIEASAEEKISADSYISYVVKDGDTLWSIAEQHSGSFSSTKECVDEIRRVNGIVNPTIYAGDLLAVPCN